MAGVSCISLDFSALFRLFCSGENVMAAGLWRLIAGRGEKG